MKLYFVRHGQTLFNYLQRVQGWSDSPLTTLGIEQGKVAANYLSSISFDSIYSSDLKRTIDTARLIIRKQQSPVNLQTTHLLREAYYGGFEGGPEDWPWAPVFLKFGYDPTEIKTNFDEALKEVLEKQSNETMRNIIAENDSLNLAENYKCYAGRITTFIDSLMEEKTSKNILIVSHGGTSQLLLENLLGNEAEISEPDNCSVSVVKIDSNKNTLLEFNNTSFL